MTWHAFRLYLLYRIKAKARHGIHSPFVYKLSEECLMRPDGLSLREKLSRYFDPETLHWQSSTPPDDWCHLIPDHISQIRIFVIPGIHRSKYNTESWNEMIKSPAITLSLDLYHVGILIYNLDIKEKQHFHLRYR